MNGGPFFMFNEGISFMVNCDTQQEIDDLWERLSAGSEQVQCGWLKDKFGVPWNRANSVEKRARSQRVMQALLKMNKIDVQALQEAYNHG